MSGGIVRQSGGAWLLGPGSARMWVLPSDATAAGVARRNVEGVCEGLSVEKVDDARLLVTELVSNALRYGTGAVTLGVARKGVSLMVQVEDESPEMPVVVELTGMEHGAGMRLVVTLASSWGVDLRSDGRTGKRVWFFLA